MSGHGPLRLRVARALLPWLCAWGLAVAAQPAAALTEPEPYRVTYRLASDDTEIGELVQALTRVAPGRWRFRSQLIPAGFLVSLVSGRIEEVTELELHDGRLRPVSYRFERRGLGKTRDVAVRFDWPALRAHNVVNGKAWSMAIPTDALDKHSLVLAVTADLRADRLADAYPVADGGKLKTYGHERQGEERLTTAVGTYDTVKLRRTRVGKQRGTLFWHAPALRHLPVMIERVDKSGRVLRLKLTSIDRTAGGDVK
jgi:hypothetical protein